MKKITHSIHLAILVLLIGFSARVEGQTCAANFSYNVFGATTTFTSNSVLTNSLTTTYYWAFGNGSTFSATGTSGMATSCTYSVNGTYVVSLFILSSAPTCSAYVQYTITITGASGCNLNANFSYSQGPNGLVNFNNVTTGGSGNSYSWNFGDNSTLNTSTSPAHTYSANGTYVATLTATSGTCISTKTLAIVVNTYCNAVASFTYVVGNSGVVNFGSTSTGATGYYFHWVFGDGGQQASNSTTASHQYQNGSYTAYLYISNSTVSPTCIDTAMQAITVTNNTCSIAANFTQTIGSGGSVSFNNTTTGTLSSTTYTWSFGNGYYSNASNPSLTYASGGIYLITLQARNASNCVSTISRTINVNTIPCVANANFSLMSTNTPQYWLAIPASPWNVANASWSWGDGATTNYSLYTAHQYSVAGSYQICLTVTASCGATASTCATYSIYHGTAGASIINVNVQQPQLINLDLSSDVGINAISADHVVYQVYPNPNTGTFYLQVNGLNGEHAQVNVTNLIGEIIYTKSAVPADGNLLQEVNLNTASGVYFVQIKTETQTFTRRIVVNK